MTTYNTYNKRKIFSRKEPDAEDHDEEIFNETFNHNKRNLSSKEEPDANKAQKVADNNMLTSTKVINDPSNEIDITDNNDDKKQEKSESNEIDITDNNDDKKHEESENSFHGFETELNFNQFLKKKYPSLIRAHGGVVPLQ